MALPRDLAPPQTGPIWNRPLQVFDNARAAASRLASNIPFAYYTTSVRTGKARAFARKDV